ncbi:MAG: hypothetical protein ACTHNW_18410 [Mucilaginibacter sp.]
MKKMNDEEIQKWLEENRQQNSELPPGDVKAYDFLFNLLETEPDKGLPYDFAANVTRKVQAEQKRNSELRSYLISMAVVTVIIACIYGLLSIVKNQQSTGILSVIMEYKWSLILSIFSLLTIQYLDTTLIKSNIFKRH